MVLGLGLGLDGENVAWLSPGKKPRTNLEVGRTNSRDLGGAIFKGGGARNTKEEEPETISHDLSC